MMKWLKLMRVGYADRDAADVKRQRCAQQQEQQPAIWGMTHGLASDSGNRASLGWACDTAMADRLGEERRGVMRSCQASFF